MRGETQDAFLERMFAKADQQRRFIRLEEEAALATVQAKKNPREHAAAVKTAQRRAASGNSARLQSVRDAQLAKKRESRERAARERTPRAERIPVATICAGACGRSLRPSWAKESQLPGTSQEFRAGKCYACTKGTTPRRKPPAECQRCRRAFRNKANPTGEVKHFSTGLCAYCYTHRDAEGQDVPSTGAQIVVCAGTCGRLTRSNGQSLADYPGTVVRVKEGRCRRCTPRPRKGQRRGPGPNAVRACLGGCGRDTRPARYSAELFPNTVIRVRQGKCRPCLLTESGERKRVHPMQVAA